jgi:UDP-N-acetylmuramoyl-L-alanyl-D-glutamate--2,6-diaminopimelate ligase
MTDRTIGDLLAAAEPTGSVPLGGLIERLTAERRLRGARLDGRAIGAAGLAGIAVRGVTNDSREVRDGSLFVAVPGLHVDGHDYVATAAAGGAAAAIVERALPEVALPQLVVSDTRTALATAAAWWYRDPSHDLAVVGITGTDGKTTTSFLAVAALEAAGIRTGMTGTAATRIGGVQAANEAHATTPEAPELQHALRAMALAGDGAAVVETTSHGLALSRVDSIAYDVAILTNLTHEHLELHGTWEAYRDAKLRLFEKLSRGRGAGAAGDASKPQRWPATGIVNADDPSAGAFIGVAQEAGARVLTYGTDPAADVRATRVEEDAHRLRIAYEAPSGAAILELQLVGRFNVHNALAVVTLGEAVGLDPAAVREGLAAVPLVPGRMERIELGQPFGVIVDFAHSPAALQTVLDLLAPLAASRGGGLIAVFGSAGERDTAKRPTMGRIAGERARIVVVTDEDPRGEDRDAILDAIARGAEAAGKRRDHDLLVIADRRAAIEAAIERARPGDIVLLAGKGHERAILGPDGPTPWNEREEAEGALHRAGFV